MKGQEATLAYLGHVLMENRQGSVVGTRLTQATGTAEREAALATAEEIPGAHRVTWGGDRHDDTQAFVSDRRELPVTPHVVQHPTGRTRAIDGRMTRHPGYALSQRTRTQVEASFSWMKTVGLLCKTRHRGEARLVDWPAPSTHPPLTYA